MVSPIVLPSFSTNPVYTMRQQSPLTILVACIGLLFFGYLPLHGQNTFHKYDHWRYRVANSFHPPAYSYTDRIYDITVLAADKHHALLSCTLLYADDSTENLRGRYHFVSSDPATWTAWDSDVMVTMALLNQPVVLNVTDHEWLGKIDGIAAVVDNAQQHWQLPPRLLDYLRSMIYVHVYDDLNLLFKRQPHKLKPGHQWKARGASFRVKAVTPATVDMSSVAHVTGDSLNIDIWEEYAMLRESNMTDWLRDTIVVVDQHRKTATYSTHIVNAHLLPIDTTLLPADTALLRQCILKSPWHHHALLYHYPTKVLMHPAGKMVALQAIKRDDVILQVCKATAIQLSKQQPERNTTDKTAHEKTDLIIGCGVYAHHRLQSTDTAKRSCPYYQHAGC